MTAPLIAVPRRRYSDPEYIRKVARTHGVNVNREFAEVFEVYRVVVA